MCFLVLMDCRRVLHSRNVDDLRNLFDVQKFGDNIKNWKLEICLKQNLIDFLAPAIFV